MFKRILVAALLWPLMALAGTYPSPTFQNVTVLGTFTSTGSIGLPSLVAQAANTVVANVTGSSASPTAVPLPSCSTSNSALQYTSGVGFSCGTAFALTTGNLSQFASTTSAQLAGVISDETGTGALVFANSPTLSGTIGGNVSFSGTITPSQTNGIVGTTTNNNANAGSIGEYVCAQVTNGGSPTGCSSNSSTPISLTTGTAANVTSISLTAGDWDVWGNVGYVATASTSVSQEAGAISTVSNTLPSAPNNGAYVLFSVITTAGSGSQVIPVGRTRLSLNATTTVYLIAFSNFGASTLTAYGFIAARRSR
jgi:hypothetical protein